MIRDTTVADAAEYYGAAPTVLAGTIGDTSVKVDSIYTQLVPNSRTETSALDQRPAAARSIVLAEAPRRVEIGVAAHTQRIKIGQENRGFNYVFMLKPLPEPGSVTISWRALGTWYELQDDGAGAFTGSGAGQLIYGTGSGSITLPVLPDAGSAIIIQWGERVGFTNRSTQGAAIRAPEYCWTLEHEGVVPGSPVFTWYSAGVLRTATTNAAGVISGDASGLIDYPSGTVLLRTVYLPDAGGEISTAYDTDQVVTEILAPGAPDAGGFVSLVLQQQPAASTLQIEWATARAVSNTSGASLTTTNATKTVDVTYTIRTVPEYREPASTTGVYVNWPRSS